MARTLDVYVNDVNTKTYIASVTIFDDDRDLYYTDERLTLEQLSALEVPFAQGEYAIKVSDNFDLEDFLRG